jgi:hypothetical protein
LLSDECPVVGILPVRKMVVEILEVMGALVLLLGDDHILAIGAAEVLVRMGYTHHLLALEADWCGGAVERLGHDTTMSIIVIYCHIGLLVIIFTHDTLNLLL